MSAWRSLGWAAEPDPSALATEHEALCLTLESVRAEVVVAPPAGLDAIYSYDAALISEYGTVLLRAPARRRVAASRWGSCRSSSGPGFRSRAR